MRQDMSIYEREKAFEIDGEDGPWVVRGRVCWRLCMACSKWMRALLAAVEIEASMSEGGGHHPFITTCLRPCFPISQIRVVGDMHCATRRQCTQCRTSTPGATATW